MILESFRYLFSHHIATKFPHTLCMCFAVIAGAFIKVCGLYRHQTNGATDQTVQQFPSRGEVLLLEEPLPCVANISLLYTTAHIANL